MATATKVLPEISVSQANKYITHNEALNRIDALLLCIVQDRSLTTPPSGPTEGTCYIPASPATDDWLGQEYTIAHFYNDSWHFYTPWYGWYVYITNEDRFVYWNNDSWVYPVALALQERSYDPNDPPEGTSIIWQANGESTGTGDDGDIMVKITAGGVTKTITLIDFSAS